MQEKFDESKVKYFFFNQKITQGIIGNQQQFGNPTCVLKSQNFLVVATDQGSIILYECENNYKFYRVLLEEASKVYVSAMALSRDEKVLAAAFANSSSKTGGGGEILMFNFETYQLLTKVKGGAENCNSISSSNYSISKAEINKIMFVHDHQDTLSKNEIVFSDCINATVFRANVTVVGGMMKLFKQGTQVAPLFISRK